MHSEIKIHSFSFLLKNYELKKPLMVFGKQVFKRDLLLIKINELETEISPLAGINVETLEECLEELKNFLQINKTIDLKNIRDFKSTSLQFAFLGLLLNEEITDFNFDAHSFISNLSSIPLNLSATCIKVKISPAILEKHWFELENLFNEMPLRNFRLDANQSFDENALIALDKRIFPYKKQIEYIEEPTADLVIWDKLKLSYPLALDESLGTLKNPLPHHLNRLILRPSSQTLEQNEKWINFALAKDLKIVIGSCYEGRIGIKNILKYINQYQILFSYHQGIGYYLN